MFWYVLLILAVPVLAVLLRFLAEPDDPGNQVTHHSDDEDAIEPPGDDTALSAA